MPLVALVVTALTLGALLVAGCTSGGSTSAAAPAKTVTASGSGTVHATPDQADMSFGVSATNANAKKALDAASKAVAKVTTALEKAGIAKEDVQTQNVSVSPNYDYNAAKPTITGYSANITVQVTVKDIGKLGDVISAANAAGADNIQGPSFTLSDDSDLHGQAIDKAVADAKKRAEAMAKAAGKTVGDVVSITEASSVSPGPLYEGDVARAAGASVPISLGQLDVVAEVTVIYELK